ncbi:hypothetical protein Tco_1440923, partial [Tanacetum coccineum]
LSHEYPLCRKVVCDCGQDPILADVVCRWPRGAVRTQSHADICQDWSWAAHDPFWAVRVRTQGSGDYYTSPCPSSLVYFLLRGKWVESSDNEESLGKDASKQGRIDAIDADEEITLVSVQNVDEKMFDVNVLDGEEVFVAKQEVVIKDVNNVVSTAGDATTVSAATTTTATITTVDDITLAQALMEIKSTKPKEKGVVI